MKSDRLLSILLLLQTRGRVPARELAERLEVSVRTIYRDVEALSTTGVPVYAERGRHGGITLLPGFRTDVTGLTDDESRALFVLAAQGAHAALGLDRALASALRKVMAALPEQNRPAAERTSRRILVDPARWRGGPQPDLDLADLHTAVFADRRLRLRYRHGGTTRTRNYTVDPYGLVVKAGVWYLVADREGEPQLFRADRVRSADQADEPVRRRTGVELADVWEFLRDRVEQWPGAYPVTVRVRSSHLGLFTRVHGAFLAAPPGEGGHGSDAPAGEEAGNGNGAGAEAEERAGKQGEEAGDGWVRAELVLPAPQAVRMLLSSADRVEVLSPPEARDELAAAAAAISGLYGDPGSA